eukprot:gene23689-9231_t
MGPYVAYLLQGPGVGTADGRPPIDESYATVRNIKIYPSASLYLSMGKENKLRTHEEFSELLRHVIITMGCFGMHMPIDSGSIEVKSKAYHRGLSKISCQSIGGVFTRVKNVIHIRPSMSPARATFILGHEMMHLWLFINGIEPSVTSFKEAVRNAMGVLVLTSMYRRYLLEGGSRIPLYYEELGFLQYQVQNELRRVPQAKVKEMTRSFMSDFIMYTPKPLVRSAVVSMYNVLTGCTDV